MTLAFALALALVQSPPPTLPIGASPEFAKAAMAVEAKLVEGDVAGARAAARLLPVRRPRIAWDDALLPAGLKADRDARLKGVIERWSQFAKDFAPQPAQGEPDLSIALVPVLPKGPDGLPLAATVASGPPFRASIGLALGDPGSPLRPEDLAKAEAYVLGRYLGVPESPFPTSAMHPDPRVDILTFMPRPDEARLASENLAVADRLRAGVEAGKPIGLSVPVIRLPKEALDLGTVDQGAPLRAEFEVENLGAGELRYTVTPDCSCFDPIPEGAVASQGRTRVRLAVNTEEYVGRQNKMVLLRSNDPLRPSIEIPVAFRSRPAYRLFRPGGDKVAVPAGGAAYDYFLFMPPGSPIHVVSAAWTGMDAKVTWEPWSGTLADPDMGEGPLPRTGWKFRIRVPANLPSGRTFGSLSIETDSPRFHTLAASLYAQKGIVADDVNLGDLTPGSEASLIVDRPNAPFKILEVKAGLLQAKWTARRGGWEYRVDLKYPGGAEKGDLLVPVRIRTDDPKQPVVEALARGYVR